MFFIDLCTDQFFINIVRLFVQAKNVAGEAGQAVKSIASKAAQELNGVDTAPLVKGAAIAGACECVLYFMLVVSFTVKFVLCCKLKVYFKVDCVVVAS